MIFVTWILLGFPMFVVYDGKRASEISGVRVALSHYRCIS